MLKFCVCGRRRHPVLLEVNARLLLHDLSAAAGSIITLQMSRRSCLTNGRRWEFDAIWLMGIWTTGEIGRQLALEHPGMMDEYRKALPDVTPDDVIGSPYAVQEYRVAASLGGGHALRSLRMRLARRGIGLILDFVCNHTARDHKWVKQHPEYYIHSDPATSAPPM